MAIRLTDDNDNRSNNNRGTSGGSSGGNGGGNGRGAIAIILLILFGLFRYPKTTILLLAIGGTLFYFYGDPKWLGIEFNRDSGDQKAMGCQLDQSLYDKVPVFEGLDATTGENTLASATTLEKYAPTRRSQGHQGSCVGWASAYAARTIVEAVETGKDPNSLVFSPAFMYNQIAISSSCNGSYTYQALEKLKDGGALPLEDFPYDVNSCARKPDREQLEAAKQFRIRDYTRISKSGNAYDIDLTALKQNIQRGGPVIIAMMVPPSFSYASGELWEPRSGERDNIDKHGGHAMCVIGYDDNKHGGAVQIMNSWGADWGDKGLIWVKYEDFLTFAREAYAVHPTTSRTIKPNMFHLKLGLWLRQGSSGKYIEMEQTGNNLFENIEPLNKGESFKIAVNNSLDCYIYIFGMEATGESYLLFPYEKTSPYFGITGTRLFPKTKSFTVDDVGNKDYMAIIASKKPLDADKILERINSSSKKGFAARVNEAVGTQAMKSPAWDVDNKGISFEGDTQGKNALTMIFAISKQ